MFGIWKPVRKFALVVGLAATLALPATAQKKQLLEYPSIHSPVVGERGMVVSQSALASKVGADILKQGGNAVDSAVAIGFALAVTLPRAGNIGGMASCLSMTVGQASRCFSISVPSRPEQRPPPCISTRMGAKRT